MADIGQTSNTENMANVSNEIRETDESNMPQPSREIHVSVRELVEFILRSGDIDLRRGQTREKDAMQMGSRLHRKIQNSMGTEYRSEVPLAAVLACDDFLIRIDGRADGIYTEHIGSTEQILQRMGSQGEKLSEEVREAAAVGKSYPVIDEIKGMMRRVDTLEEPYEVHLAQARCYAYMYGAERDIPLIGVRMTYANLETEEKKYFNYVYTWEETERWFLELAERYKAWARLEQSWIRERNASIKKMEFPFDYRDGQAKLVRDVYLTIRREKTLFLQAPTGTGKTISTLFPAVKSMGEGESEKIFYLTARTIGRQVAMDTLDIMRERGLRFKSVVLTAKEKICLCDQVNCNPEDCPYARGHYDRINDALFALLQNETRFGRERILEAARQYQLCPFELSLDLALWADGIVSDYNYAFHPRAKLRRFFGESVKRDYVLLVDEAHNMIDRGQDMFSAVLYKEDFLAVRRRVSELHHKAAKTDQLARSLGRCNKHLLEMKRSCDGEGRLEDIGTLPLSLLHLTGLMEEFLDHCEGIDGEVVDAVRDLYFQVNTFLEIWDGVDDHYVIYDRIEGDGRFLLELYCVDPSHALQQTLDQVRAAVFFSATLLPVNYYKKLLCEEKEPYAVYADSCFDPSHLRVLIGRDVSSRYTRRGEEEYRRMAAYIRSAVSARRGNYLVFFPSYRMMEEVGDCLRDLLEKGESPVELMVQESGMTEQQREAFLEAFALENPHTLVGLCVMGSIFSEGIDLQGERLIGSIVVGTGIPQVGFRRKLLQDYYTDKGMDGFAYAYQYPGMNKVLQAAGRVIRTQTDRGMVLLLDERFCQLSYRELFPREWADVQITGRGQIPELLEQFWGQQGEPEQ